MLESVEKSAIIEHEMNYDKDKSSTKIKTHLVLIKDKEYDWCFYTNLYLKDAQYYISLYKHRWQIETNFRVEDEAKIKSKSVHYLVRYFYFMLTLLLHTIWLIFPYKQFKWFLIQLYEYMFLKDLKINSSSC
jgi:IS4 transposase